jgi:hypothetical protein
MRRDDLPIGLKSNSGIVNLHHAGKSFERFGRAQHRSGCPYE